MILFLLADCLRNLDATFNTLVDGVAFVSIGSFLYLHIICRLFLVCDSTFGNSCTQVKHTGDKILINLAKTLKLLCPIWNFAANQPRYAKLVSIEAIKKYAYECIFSINVGSQLFYILLRFSTNSLP